MKMRNQHLATQTIFLKGSQARWRVSWDTALSVLDRCNAYIISVHLSYLSRGNIALPILQMRKLGFRRLFFFSLSHSKYSLSLLSLIFQISFSLYFIVKKLATLYNLLGRCSHVVNEFCSRRINQIFIDSTWCRHGKKCEK